MLHRLRQLSKHTVLAKWIARCRAAHLPGLSAL